MPDPDPIAQALQSWVGEPGDRTAAAVLDAVVAGQVVVPVAAVGQGLATSPLTGLPIETRTDIEVATVIGRDGRRALPAFSSPEQLLAWRPELRPLPVPGLALFAGAAAQGLDAVIIDLAGAAFVVEGELLGQLAAVGDRLLARPPAG